MPIVTLRQILDEAAKGRYGVGAFNVSDMEQVQAVMEAAAETKSPVIIQVSRGAREYSNDNFLYHLILAAVELYPNIPVALHQDHGNSPALCKSAIEIGFSSVMIDGSLKEDGKTPASYEYNLKVTKEVVKYAHARGVSVEAELGVLGGAEDGHGAKINPLAMLTDPDQAVDFVNKTGIDALALAFGTSHGAYKFDRQPDSQVLKIDLIKEINRRLPHTHLVMHGSSSVPKSLLDVINANGGKIKETYGVPIKEIQKGIKNGVRKINVDTDCRLAMTGAVRQVLKANPAEFDPRKYLGPARLAMKKVVIERMKAFGQAGHAGDYSPIPLSKMIKIYKKGK